MAIDIVIPTLGESVTEGVIAKWLKNDGEYVKQDESVLELETDKITMELPAPASGVVTHGAKAGDTVAVGASVGRIDEAAKPAPAVSAGRFPAPARSEPDGVQPPAKEMRGAPASAKEATRPSAVLAGGGMGPGSAGTRRGTSGASGPSPAVNGHGDTTEVQQGVRATPTARKLADEQGVDISGIHGTGPGGRVREQDVLTMLESGKRAQSAVVAAPSPLSAPPAPPSASRLSGSRQVRLERMSPLRQRVAARLVEAQHTAAMLTTFNEADMTAVMDLRKKYKESFEKQHGIGLGFMSFFVKAAVSALGQFPSVNASIVPGQGSGGTGPQIEFHDYCDIAVAIGTPKGLVVPVLRDCQSLSFAQIESGIKDLAARAKEGKLTLSELQGGTFTITNGGVYGSLMSTPILNPPQTGILGMHAIKNRAVEDPARPGQVAIRPMMYLALSYDHRLIDGSEAVQFLVAVKQAIEDPERILLGV